MGIRGASRFLLLLALCLSKASLAGDVPRRLLATEAGVSTGFGGAGYTAVGARFGDLYTTRAFNGRLVLRGFTVDAHARLDLPLAGERLSQSGILELRLGWTSQAWAAAAGVVVHHGFAATPPFQVVPSVRAEVKLGEVRLVAGLFDYGGFAPAHLSVERGDFGVGYLAPFGLESHFHLRVREYIGVTLQAMVLRIGNAELVMATLAIKAGYAAGTPPTDRAPVPAVLDDRM
ncbi:MAG: hypothetical protein ACYC8T_02175 [Myxococcaceae bacterium]